MSDENYFAEKQKELDTFIKFLKEWFDMLNSMGIFDEDVMEDMYANAALHLANKFPHVQHNLIYREILR